MEKVLITGASRGIGREIAKMFAEAGYEVYANYNKSEENAKSLLKELREKNLNINIIKADVSNEKEVENMFTQIKGVDILINNAGISQFKLFSDMTIEDFDNMINTNLRSVFLCSKYAIKKMLDKQAGKIINISSIWGVTGASMEVHYSTAKAGVIGFTKALAKEMGPSNIQVNCIAPGVIDTDMNASLTEEEKKDLIDETPLCKIGKASDVAKLALFLAKDNFITGEVININGGFHI